MDLDASGQNKCVLDTAGLDALVGCKDEGCACEYGSSTGCEDGLVCLDLDATGENKCVAESGRGMSSAALALLLLGGAVVVVVAGVAASKASTKLRARRGTRSTRARMGQQAQQPLTTELPSITLDVSQQVQTNAYTSRSTYVRGSPLAEFSSK